jgi:hypothetical protein
MAEKTLSDVSKNLRDQNEILEESLGNQERLLMILIDQGKKRDTLDNLETAREESTNKSDKTGDLDRLEKTRESKGSSGGLGNGLMGAGLLGTGVAIGTGLLRRGIPSAIAVTMADEIGEYVTGQTGSKELGDAVERGLVAGGIGLLFGKKIGIISGLFGAVLTEENQKKLEELGKSLEPGLKELKTNVEELIGTSLPTSKEILTGVEKTFGNAITGLNQLVTGDFKGLTENLDDIALSAAGMYAILNPRGALNTTLKAVKAPFAATATALKTAAGVGTGIKTARAANAATGAGTIGGKQVVKTQAGNLAYAGKDGKATTNLVDAKDAKKFKPSSVDVGKFPKLSKFMKLIKGGGPLAAIIGAADIGLILSSPGSIDQKVDQLGAALGSSIGGLSGGAAGALAGGLFTGPLAPFGSVLGGIGGGILGAFAGDTIGMAIAQYLFGKKVDAFGFPFGWINDALNSGNSANTSDAATPPTSRRQGRGRKAAGVLPDDSPPSFSKPAPTTGTSVAQSVANTTGQQSSPTVVSPITNTSIGSTSTTLVGSGTNTIDINNPNFMRAMEAGLVGR